MTPEIVFALDLPQLLNLLLAVVFPVLVGLVTTKVTSSTIKAVLLATISLASGLVFALLNAVLAGVPFDIVAALLTGLAAWIIAIATHLGFWKPAGVTEKVQSIGSPPVAEMAQSHVVQTNYFIHEDPAVVAEVASQKLRRDLRGD